MSRPSLRYAAISHHCAATTVAGRARAVLTSTPVFGRNAQQRSFADGVAINARGKIQFGFRRGDGGELVRSRPSKSYPRNGRAAGEGKGTAGYRRCFGPPGPPDKPRGRGGRPKSRKQLTRRSWRPASDGPCVEVIVRLAA
jgi:hypothetical protein